MIVVFGSINLDLVTRVPRLPSPGETLIGSGFASYPGGKGANQALAAARAGAVVRMYGAVGRDPAASNALSLLRAASVDVAGIRAVDAPTGCATILVDDAGENAIVVVPGANERAYPDAVPDAVLTVFPLDTFLRPAALTMQVVGDATTIPQPVKEFGEVFARHGRASIDFGKLEREAFYARARNAYAVVRTGDLRPYGNILLVKGVVNAYPPTD